MLYQCLRLVVSALQIQDSFTCDIELEFTYQQRQRATATHIPHELFDCATIIKIVQKRSRREQKKENTADYLRYTTNATSDSVVTSIHSKTYCHTECMLSYVRVQNYM